MLPNLSKLRFFDGLHTDAPPNQALESPSETAFREVFEKIAEHLELEDFAVLLKVNKTFKAFALIRITPLKCLLIPPFELKWSQILSLKKLYLWSFLEGEGEGEEEIKKLHLRQPEMATFAAAVAIGALPRLQDLSLNYFGVEGMKVFFEALEKGALPRLQKLSLSENNFGDGGMQVFSEALENGALPLLHTLHLLDNYLGDDGMKVFCDALCNKALPVLTHFAFHDIKDGIEVMRVFFEVLGQGARDALLARVLGEPYRGEETHPPTVSFAVLPEVGF